MDSIVTARVPVEVKIRLEVLESLGQTPTSNLINAAFEYRLVTRFPIVP